MLINKDNFVLGGAQFGNNYGLKKIRFNINQTKFFLKCANKFGFKEFDSAIDYKVNKKTYTILLKLGFKISSKLPYLKNISLNKINSALREKVYYYLRSNNIPKLNILYIHDTNILKKKKKLLILFNFLEELKKKNIINKIGISIYSPTELFKIKKMLNNKLPDIVQFPCNVLDKRFCAKKFLTFLKKFKITPYVRSIFLQGLLLLNEKERPNFFLKYRTILNKWDNHCNYQLGHKISNSVNFIRKQKSFKNIIIGFDNIDNLKLLFKKIVNRKFINFRIKKKIDKGLIDPRKWKIK